MSTTQVPQTVTGAGHSMNYATWPANTVIRLANVPWNNDYRDVVRFDTDAAFRTFVVNQAGPVTITGGSFARFGDPINIAVPFNKASNYNYVVVENPSNPSGDDAGLYPYFITGVEYVNPGTTRIYVQLDVWQMFGRRVDFGRGYVERGHVGIANENQSRNNGRDFLTVPEGLDLGGDYIVAQTERTELKSSDVTSEASKASVIVVSTVSFEDSGGDVDNPKMSSARGTFGVNSLPSGADIYFFENTVKFTEFLTRHQDQPWMTQGIIAAYLIPAIATKDIRGTKSDAPDDYYRITGYPRVKRLSVFSNWESQMMKEIPARYAHLRKFLTNPYSVIEMTMNNGVPIVMKPEMLQDASKVKNLEVDVHYVITPPSPRIMISPVRYGMQQRDAVKYVPGQLDAEGEWLDFATGIINLPQLPVVNNMYMSYLASNQNSIAFQHRSADWSQQRVMQGAQTSFDQTTGQMATNTALTNQANNASWQSTAQSNQTSGLRALSGGAMSMGGGFAKAGGAGLAAGAISAGMGAANAAIDINQATNQTAISTQLARTQTRTSNSQAGLVRDTNLDFAAFASKGDYENAIAGINAKIQDAQMIQPTTSGQSGGDGFMYSLQGGYFVHCKMKLMNSNAMTMIGEYWLRYGYAVNRFHKLSKLNVMSKFTYWKVKELYITSSRCPETYRQSIRGIFEKGVTVWENANDIASLDIGNNKPLTGVVLT